MSTSGLPPGERAGIVRDAVAVGIATGAYGVGFGAISVSSGLSLWQTCVLSLLMFTGASQFALVGVLGAGGAPVSAATTALMLGTRNTLYGLRMGPLLGWTGLRRLGAAHLLIDESTAMGVTRDSATAARLGFLSTGLSVFVLWNLATLIGAVGGQAFGDPGALGLDAAVGAAFLALLWPRLRDRTNLLVTVASGLLALALVEVVAPGIPVLAAAGVALLVGVLTRDRRDDTEVPTPDDIAGGAA